MAETPVTLPIDFTTTLGDRIDAELLAHTRFDEGCPSRLREAIHYSLLSPGKRLRPVLVLISAEACGCDLDVALPAACAVEMVHAYSLIHDDLPAMDDDDLRRGRPTCHKVFGEALAILAGDALLTRAFEMIASEVQPAEVAAKCCAALGRAAGATAMVGGQVDDLDGENRAEVAADDEPLAHLESIHRRKTAAMLQAAVHLGGLVAQVDQQALSALDAYAKNLGLAFQIVDDLLDADGVESATGKRVRKDSARGKLTYPSLLGVEQSRQRARQLIDDACAALSPFGERGEKLEALARYVVERDH